jgi:hypothetical protein
MDDDQRPALGPRIFFPSFDDPRGAPVAIVPERLGTFLVRLQADPISAHPAHATRYQAPQSSGGIYNRSPGVDPVCDSNRRGPCLVRLPQPAALLQWLAPVAPIAEYIDFRAFTSLLSRTHPSIALIVVGLYASWVAVRLLSMWLRSVGAGSSASAAVWATTITLTLLLNFYVPIYDSILLVLSTTMTGHLTKKFAGRWFEALCLLFFVSSWFTVQLAERTGIQVATIFIAALSVMQMNASEMGIGTRFNMQAQVQPARNRES